MKSQSLSLLPILIISAHGEILKEAESSWDYLLYSVGETPVDPAAADVDFHSTWQDPVGLGYDGPVFTTAEGYFGYGEIGNRTIDVNIWNPDGLRATDAPPSGLRHTCYFVSTFTPTAEVTYLKFSGIIDDGLVIYLDGVELTRINMLAKELSADSWLTTSDGNGSEGAAVEHFAPASLPAGVPVTIGVSLHNSSGTSTDLGFELAIESTTFVLPPNDDFSDAIELTGALPISTTATTDNGIGESGATTELGEPDHAGVVGNGSLWWHWTPAVSERVAINAKSGDVNAVLAVYTGSAVDGLSAVNRYANLAVPASSVEDDEAFYSGARVEFDAVAGMTYRIALDAADDEFGESDLTIDATANPLDPVAEIFPARSDWSYLLLVDGTNQPIDPESLDVDFDTTWHTAAGYDGPAFSGPSPALLKYGSIDGDPTGTDIWGDLDHDNDGDGDSAPPEGLRYATYFRTSFTPTTVVKHLGFEGLFDDGAIVYINGVEVERINVDDADDALDWQVFADGTTGEQGQNSEQGAQYGIAYDQNLAAGVPVEVAVSLHNSSANSSDMGLDMRIFAINAPDSGVDFAASLEWLPNGNLELSWNSTPGASYRVESSLDLNVWSEELGGPYVGDLSGVNSVTVSNAEDGKYFRVVLLPEA